MTIRPLLVAPAILPLLCFLSSAAGQSEPFPFVFRIDNSDSPASFADLNSEPAGSHGFVRIQDEHFATDRGRIRFWGVNLCFGANFPEHDDAENLAKRLAEFGINAVRIHHHETQFSPRGLYKPDGTIDPQQMDRLDYLFAELHKLGIYVNINLHVGRSVVRQKRMPELSSSYSASGDKHALLFMPEIQEAFWQYCRDYLGHKNPYRDLERNQDPGIAMIEILNENRFSREGPRYLKAAPEPYRTEILRRWNGWLKSKYGSDDSLRAAWRHDGAAAGAPIADSDTFKPHSEASRAGPAGGNWIVMDNGGAAPLTFTSGGGAIRIEPQKSASEGWHQQLAAEKLTFHKDEVYSLDFEVRADATKKISFNNAAVDGGWRQLGLGDSVTATPDWQTVSLTFIATETVEDNARLAFDLGGNNSPIEFRNLRLCSGSNWTVLPDGQSIESGSVTLPDSKWTPQARAAAVAFMQDLEREFYSKTIRLLRDELGITVPVCATQVNYIGAKLAGELGDYTDLHSYWNHPLFPGRDWDSGNWRVSHEPIEAEPYSNKWPRNSPLMRAAWRIHGKPFTYSEWNTGEPSLPAAGGVPIMALMASLQDWDAVFFFDFEDQGGRWDSDRLDGFFRLNSQPCKLALLGPFGQLYRQGQLPPMREVHASAEGEHYSDGALAFTKRVGLDPKRERVTGTSPPDSQELAVTHPPILKTKDGTAEWDARDPAKARIIVNTPQTKAVWGLLGGQTIKAGDWKMTFGKLPGDYGVFVAISRDGKPLHESSSISISAVNHGENSTMPWKEEQTTLGSDWGKGPTVTWAVPVQITFPHQGKVIAQALNAAGKPCQTLPVLAREQGIHHLKLGPEAKTINYWLTSEE